VVTSNLEQYAIADFVEWHEKKQLKLNPDFQRQSVWPTPARSYLIDTILRRLPIPKIFMRTSVDIQTQRTYREVVDGQQRLRTIIEFAEDKFTLGPRAKEFQGLRYSTLTDELKERFLSYRVSVDQLINASDDDVLEIFARLNSYTVPVNAPELRHAKYQGDFRWAVHETSTFWKALWDDLSIVSGRERVRLMNDSLMAEMFGVILDGVRDGGQPKITALYDKYDKDFDRGRVDTALNTVLPLLIDTFRPALLDTAIHSAPHFLLAFAALTHSTVGIPAGDLDPDVLQPGGLAPSERVLTNLYTLGALIEQDEPRGSDLARAFWRASKSSTQRISSRRVRFPVYLAAFQDRLEF
jgi:uncharacterized protein DUF262